MLEDGVLEDGVLEDGVLEDGVLVRLEDGALESLEDVVLEADSEVTAVGGVIPPQLHHLQDPPLTGPPLVAEAGHHTDCSKDPCLQI